MAVDDDFRPARGRDRRHPPGLERRRGQPDRRADAGRPDAPRLPDGAQLESSQTDQPVNFDEVMSTRSTRATRRGHRRAARRARRGAPAAAAPDIDRTLRHSAPALDDTADLLAQVNQRRRGAADDRAATASAWSRRSPAEPAGPGRRGRAPRGAARHHGGPPGRAARERARARPRAGRGPRGRSTRSPPPRPSCAGWRAAAGPAIDELGPLARLLPGRDRRAPARSSSETRRLVERGPRADPRSSARSPARRRR